MAAVTLVAVTLAVGSSPAVSEAGDNRPVTVMTQNLYLGASLAPALRAQTPAQLVGATALIYGTMLFTNFPARAEMIADEIMAESPDLIGLQEVSRWVARPTQPGPTPQSFDFLQILRAELAERGLQYKVAAVSENADIGPVPLIAPDFGCAPFAPDAAPLCEVSLQDRDVILVNKRVKELKTSNPTSGHFATQVVVQLPGAPAPLSFDRGWVSVDVTFDDANFRFVNTHLETEDFPPEQVAQARELLAGPLRPGGALIAVGDFNSAADGSTTATYRILTSAGLVDAWSTNPSDPGFTCCQDEKLLNLVSLLSQRIDLVLTGGAVPVEVHRVGIIPFEPVPPFWPSDHAGVVADVLVF